MAQYGNASVYGVDGSVQYNDALAIAAFVDSIEGEQRAQIEEFMSGVGELIGFRIRDVREYCDLIIVPKGGSGVGSLDKAFKALKYPATPSKITLTNLPDSGATDIGHNGDYIYFQGARRTIVEGRAALRFQCFRTTTGLSVASLLTPCS